MHPSPFLTADCVEMCARTFMIFPLDIQTKLNTMDSDDTRQEQLNARLCAMNIARLTAELSLAKAQLELLAAREHITRQQTRQLIETAIMMQAAALDSRGIGSIFIPTPLRCEAPPLPEVPAHCVSRKRKATRHSAV